MQESPTRPSTGKLVFSALFTAAGLLLCVLAILPAAGISQWLSTRVVVAQAVSFPIAFGIGLAIIAAVFGAFRFVVAPLVWSVAAACFIAAPVPPLLPGSLHAQEMSSAGGASESFSTLRVVTYNSQNTLTAADVQDIVDCFDPHVVVLPEASNDKVVAAFAGTSFAERVFTSDQNGGIAPTSLALHPDLGAAQPIDAPPTTWGSLAFETAAGPTIVAVHTIPPLPSTMDQWRGDLGNIATWVDANPDNKAIIAGDFNATMRHGPMADLGPKQDSARMCSRYPDGTWPTSGIMGLRTHIDHVLVPAAGVDGCATAHIGNGDHLAYFVEISTAGRSG
nr:endonuclease/exonuclease/phosphatase family [Streptococcus thermophilus]